MDSKAGRAGSGGRGGGDHEGSRRAGKKGKKGKRGGGKGGKGGKVGGGVPGTRLATSWSFWYDRKLPRGAWAEMKKKDATLSYRELQKNIGSFSTVEEFWRYYVFLRRPSELGSDVNLYCFRSGCAPMWEDFPRGGCWILKVRRGDRTSSPTGRLWQELLFAAIGEQLGGHQVVGVQLAARARDDMLAVWTRDDQDYAARFGVSERLKKCLGLADASVVEYKPHQRSLKEKSGFRNADAFMYVDKSTAAATAAAATAAALSVSSKDSGTPTTSSPHRPRTASLDAHADPFHPRDKKRSASFDADAKEFKPRTAEEE